MPNYCFTNATPHAVVLRAADGVDLLILPCGQVARVEMKLGTEETPSDFPCALFGADERVGIVDLVSPREGVFVIVSAMVADAIVTAGMNRPDVLVPGTGPKDGAIRDAEGRLVAVTRLKRIPTPTR